MTSESELSTGNLYVFRICSIPFPGFRLLGAVFGGICGAVHTVKTHLSGNQQVKRYEKLHQEAKDDEAAKRKHITDCTDAIEQSVSEKERKEMQLAWKNWDLEQHFQDEANHKQLMVKVSQSHTMIRDASVQLGSLEQKSSALVSWVSDISHLGQESRRQIGFKVTGMVYDFAKVYRCLSTFDTKQEHQFLVELSNLEDMAKQVNNELTYNERLSINNVNYVSDDDDQTFLQ